jgi:4-amino-4-deoxy-L-arabinose transferase-like glycosyltransferase
MARNHILIALGIICLAAILRFTSLNDYPYGINQDEASRAYEAYSLLQTGHDSFGHRWPITLESFSAKRDNASAIHTYLSIPTVAIFGPSVLAVRLPAAFAGTLTVVVLMVLAWLLARSYWVVHLAGFSLAVSNWHLFISRLGHEAVWAPLFFLVGLTAFVYALRSPKWYLVSAFSWAVCLYGYPVAKLVVPLSILMLFFAYHHQLRKHLQWLVIAGSIGLLLLIPLFIHNLHGWSDLGRAQEVSIFTSAAAPWWRALLENIFHWISPFEWMRATLSSTPLDWVLALLGLPLFFISVHPSKNPAISHWLVAALLGISVLPAIFTNFNPNMMRGVMLVGILHFIGAWGLISFLQLLFGRSRIFIRAVVVVCIIALGTFSLTDYFRPAFSQNSGYAKITHSFTPEVQPLVQLLTTRYAHQSVVYIRDDNLTFFQIYLMMLTPWDPRVIEKDRVNVTKDDGWYRTTRLGRYVFCSMEECKRYTDGIFVEATTGSHLGERVLQRIPIAGHSKGSLAWVISANL